jgi:hypothetical protein
LIKDIYKINNCKIKPFSVATNNIDKIYIFERGTIFETDLELVFKNQYDDILILGNRPVFITFYDDFLYACVAQQNLSENDFEEFDIDNCIVKFDSKLKLQAKYYLEFEPIQITIINNIACVIFNIEAQDPSSVIFYELKDFKILYKYKIDFPLYSGIYRDYFIILHNGDEGCTIWCYNMNGSLSESVNVARLIDTCRWYNGANFKKFLIEIQHSEKSEKQIW